MTSSRPVIILRNAMRDVPCNPMNTTHQVIQEFGLGIELVDESRETKASLSAKMDQRVKLGVECALQEDHSRICDRNSCLSCLPVVTTIRMLETSVPS